MISILFIPSVSKTISNNIRNNFNLLEKSKIYKYNYNTDNNQFNYSKLLTKVTTCRFPSNDEINPDEINIVLDKNLKLETDYVPNDLINLSSLNIKTKGNILLREEASKALLVLFNELKILNVDASISSGYRDFETQAVAYNFWLYSSGKKIADLYAAPIGSSEHHLGTTIDILSGENNYKLDGFEKTKLYNFLRNNAYKFGFSMSYPKDKENLTGYSFEPWHFRYLGLELSKYLHENNLTLTEYMYNHENYCLLSY